MSFEETLAIADAMAMRQGKITAISEKIMASLQGMPYQPKTQEQIRRTHIGKQISLMARIEQPDVKVKLEELIDADNKDSGYAELAEILSNDVIEVNAEHIRNFAQSVVQEIKTSMGDIDEKMTRDFANGLKIAREIAAERNVTVAEVYLNDELYYETLRRCTPFEEAVETYCKLLETFSDDMFNRLIVTQMQNVLPKEMLEMISPEELSEMMFEMQLDPDMQAMLSQQVETAREGMRQVSEFTLTATYGDDALDRVTAEQRELLAPRQGRVPDHVDFTA